MSQALSNRSIELQADVGQNQLKIATERLQSAGFCGCYALVAEYRNAGDIAGMLGHFDPSLVMDLLQRRFRPEDQSLRNMGYQITRIYVFCRDTDDLKEQFASVKSQIRALMPSAELAAFATYECPPGKGLALTYQVQHRWFLFGTKHGSFLGRQTTLP